MMMMMMMMMVIIIRSLTRLRFLRFGNPALEELRRGDLAGVRQLDQLEVYGNNLKRYDPGSLGDLWPLGVVTLHLRGPFQDNLTLVSSILHDVCYPETFLVVVDVLLTETNSVAPFSETNQRRVRSIMFQNATLTDEAIVHFLEVCHVHRPAVQMQDLNLTSFSQKENNHAATRNVN
uniref:Uncharacterized protein n=1 Tax=Hucho hucho TaxID=62062 RepID=A0A4W5PST4_9TELE